MSEVVKNIVFIFQANSFNASVVLKCGRSHAGPMTTFMGEHDSCVFQDKAVAKKLKGLEDGERCILCLALQFRSRALRW